MSYLHAKTWHNILDTKMGFNPSDKMVKNSFLVTKMSFNPCDFASYPCLRIVFMARKILYLLACLFLCCDFVFFLSSATACCTVIDALYVV